MLTIPDEKTTTAARGSMVLPVLFVIAFAFIGFPLLGRAVVFLVGTAMSLALLAYRFTTYQSPRGPSLLPFYLLTARFLGFHLTPGGFLQLNIVAWIIMLCTSVLATRYVSLNWLIVPFAGATFINGCAHVIASLITTSYSPGLISGLALWIPLGAISLRRFYRDVSHKVFWVGVSVGVLLHVLVTISAIAG